MKMMMKAASVVQGGAAAVQKTKEFMLSNLMLVAGLAILLLALLLRWLGVM